jgi:hypothetical protein
MVLEEFFIIPDYRFEEISKLHEGIVRIPCALGITIVIASKFNYTNPFG